MPMRLWTDRGEFLSNALPSDTATNFGGSGLTFPDEGNIVRFATFPGITPTATGVDNVLAVFSLPASSFDIAGRGLNFLAMGSFAANASNKQVKIIYNATTAVVGATVTGGVTIADTGTSAGNAVGWQVEANVFKYGLPGSNTQLGIHQSAQVGATVSTLLIPNALTAVESGAILVAVTGKATTTATDILLAFWEVNAMN